MTLCRRRALPRCRHRQWHSQPRSYRANERQECMGQDHIRYDILAQDALRGVIRKVLTEVAAHRPPARRPSLLHHLPDRRARRAHLAAPEVEISRADDDRHPAPVLGPEGHRDAISRSACPSPTCRKSWSIPFNAIRGFYDPSVNFELEFDVPPRATRKNCRGGEITAYPVDADTPGEHGADQRRRGRRSPARSSRSTPSARSSDVRKHALPLLMRFRSGR